MRKPPSGDLKTPLLITVGDPAEYWSIAETAQALRADIERALGSGEVAPDDVRLWVRMLRLPASPERGSYLVAISYRDGVPVEVFSDGIAHHAVHAHFRNAASDIKEQGATSEWMACVWKEVNVQIETATAVHGIYLPKRGDSSRRKRLA